MLGFKKNKQQAQLKDAVTAQLRTIFDPEIPVNIYDLGLIYDVAVQADNHIHIQMTLTSPGCPVAQTFHCSGGGSAGTSTDGGHDASRAF